MYKHRMITHPMDHCGRSVGQLEEYGCNVCFDAPDQVRISPCLHCDLHTVMPLHHYCPPNLPTVLRWMPLPPLPPPDSRVARE